MRSGRSSNRYYTAAPEPLGISSGYKTRTDVTVIRHRQKHQICVRPGPITAPTEKNLANLIGKTATKP